MCDCSSSCVSRYSCITLPPSTPSSIHRISFFGSSDCSTKKPPPKFSFKISQNSNPSSEDYQFLHELKFKERQTRNYGFELGKNGQEDTNFLRLDGNLRENEGDKEDFVKIRESEDDLDMQSEELDDDKNNQVKVIRKGKQTMKRSSLIAKQVISIRSALSLGFISQLWVDTNAWMVVIVEVRPNLLSGEQERFFLKDTRQVGDVVLIEDETVMDNVFRLVGLETLVGYSVVTPGRRDIGKVRGYSFNINSGAIESLELDSFGISIIPSSLVSTYALLVEDVVEVGSDTIVVHEAAATRIQRLTKGFWDAQRAMEDVEDYYSEYGKGRRRRSGRRRDVEGDWEVPMDYL